MTIDLTPEELETIIDALTKARNEFHARAAWFSAFREYEAKAKRCMVLLDRLGELAKEVEDA